ncbi:DNA-directed RNA polymerase subunit alpha [candidate division Kazan bacterium RBG_13_50_9]|uniref:DNA-directed RNA polymerase subunit alpha n=1 Tax=candidate division Kazan bacterium RBG_13_50_9 TaxID=1798535 RepID=A0A1F4NT42_UNCK3|nr:MAG: DNA-directed RNA polymerase subunit alpha [candidate division Kazan bacterium RBG_13_50_9]
MEVINIPKVKLEKEADNSAVFVIEPFYPGYGTTVGNALRRVLLTSLPGAAATAFRIVGVDHEFTTIEGIREDLVEVMLNIKGLHFILYEAGPVTVTLKATKSGPVTGRDIKLPSSVELVNLDHHIATISGKTSLEAEIRIERGRGYILSHEIDSREFAIGMIAIDAAFSPVRRCSIQVENTRVGERVDYDKLTLELETDGTITPRDAIKQASEILLEQFSIFGGEVPSAVELATEARPSTAVEESGGVEQDITNPKNFSVEEINLSIRTTNALTQNGVKKVKDILAAGREGLLEMKGVGERAVSEIADKMDELGLEFN